VRIAASRPTKRPRVLETKPLSRFADAMLCVEGAFHDGQPFRSHHAPLKPCSRAPTSVPLRHGQPQPRCDRPLLLQQFLPSCLCRYKYLQLMPETTVIHIEHINSQFEPSVGAEDLLSSYPYANLVPCFTTPAGCSFSPLSLFLCPFFVTISSVANLSPPVNQPLPVPCTPSQNCDQ
jgi:hypothetical protein